MTKLPTNDQVHILYLVITHRFITVVDIANMGGHTLKANGWLKDAQDELFSRPPGQE